MNQILGCFFRSHLYSRVQFCIVLLLGSCALYPDRVSAQTSQITCLHPQGSEHYRVLCQLIIGHLENQSESGHVYSLADRLPGEAPLTGAMDILDAIASERDTLNRTFLGFTQSDVAYYFRYGGHPLYPTPHHRRNEVVSLARIYPEYLHIYSAGTNQTETVDLHRHLETWNALHVGPLGSGTLITSLNILSILGRGSMPGTASQPRASTFQDHFWNRSDELEEPYGAMLVTGLGHPRIADGLRTGAGRLVSLTPPEERHLKTVYSQFYETERINSYRSQEVAMLRVPALLVASKKLPAAIAVEIKQFLAILDEKGGTETLRAFYEGLPNPRERPTDLLIEQLGNSLDSYSRTRHQRLVLSTHRAIPQHRQDAGLVELAVALFTICLALALGRAALGRMKANDSVLDLSPFLTGLVALSVCVAWLHLCLFFVWHLERSHYLNYGTDILSPFVQHNYGELLPMVLHYIASAFSAERLVPINRLAQLLWLSIPVIVGASALAGIVHTVVPPALHYLRTHAEQEEAMELDNHLVIVNWHTHAERVIHQLRTQENMESGKDPTIVILSDSTDKVTLPSLGTRQASNLPQHELFALPPRSSESEDDVIMKVVGFTGDSRDEPALQMTHPEAARSIIIFPDLSHPEPDSATLITVLKLQAILGEASDSQIIVWCEDARNVDIFLDPRLRLSDVCSNEWTWRMVCQATRVRHVSNIYRRLLTSSADTNEFYEYKLPSLCAGLSFGEAQQAVFSFNSDYCKEIPGVEGKRNTILLVGVVSGDDEARDSIHLNPAADKILRDNDSLILLTYIFDLHTARRLGEALKAFRASEDLVEVEC